MAERAARPRKPEAEGAGRPRGTVNAQMYGQRDYGGREESLDEVLSRLKEKYPSLEKDERVHGNGPAVYYRLPGSEAAKGGAIGLISAMHHRFCDSCNRIRLTSLGLLKPCLCYEEGTDLKEALHAAQRTGGNETDVDAAIRSALEETLRRKPQGHTFQDRATVEPRAMSQIGG